MPMPRGTSDSGCMCVSMLRVLEIVLQCTAAMQSGLKGVSVLALADISRTGFVISIRRPPARSVPYLPIWWCLFNFTFPHPWLVHPHVVGYSCSACRHPVMYKGRFYSGVRIFCVTPAGKKASAAPRSQRQKHAFCTGMQRTN